MHQVITKRMVKKQQMCWTERGGASIASSPDTGSQRWPAGHVQEMVSRHEGRPRPGRRGCRVAPGLFRSPPRCNFCCGLADPSASAVVLRALVLHTRGDVTDAQPGKGPVVNGSYCTPAALINNGRFNRTEAQLIPQHLPYGRGTDRPWGRPPTELVSAALPRPIDPRSTSRRVALGYSLESIRIP